MEKVIVLCMCLLLCCAAVPAAGFDPNSEPDLMLFYQFEDSLAADSTGSYSGGAAGGAASWVDDAPLQLSLNGLLLTSCLILTRMIRTF